ncbi:MAG: hypothetical protein HOQ21_13090 [Dermatophilaceae bacterium]|nr:hypothetical protein [Dermatophilaceae bacterium]
MPADVVLGRACPALATQQLDPTALTRLAAELESSDLARSIARTYLRMLEGRLSRASAALARRDDIAAMDVLLSLRVSSATVGLVRLEAAVLGVIDAVRGGEGELARELGAAMASIAPDAGAALQSHLDATASGPAAVDRLP